MRQRFFYILLITTCFIASIFAQSEAKNSYSLLTKETSLVAGNQLSLKFSYTGNPEIDLFCSHSYGSLLLQPKVDRGILNFEIPPILTNKSGVLNWKLLASDFSIEGQILIKPQNAISHIESYLGPPSIEAGGKDYTNLVVIPTDKLDNALPDSTQVNIKHQFLDTSYSEDIFMTYGIGFIDIYSEQKSGRILISSECQGLSSKELDVNVMPAIPTDFKIDFSRVHDYADGNQITTFKTSIIRDAFANIVSDGTLVNFFITSDSGFKSKMSGATINGIAKAKILNPFKAESWSVKAYVEGMAESNALIMSYKQAIKDFDVILSKDQTQIKVGPLMSFMNQRIPDGFRVKLEVYQNDSLENAIIGYTNDGKVTFKINKIRYKKTIVNFLITAAGITKTIENISYD